MDIDHYLVSAARRAHRLRPQRSYVMGRDQHSDIQIQDAMSSRRHAELHCEDESWVVEDLGSRNGTLINGKRLEGRHVLADEDRLQIGGQVYQYHMVPPGCDLGQLSSQAPQIEDEATMHAGVSASDVFVQGAAFSGAITDGGVLELLQFVAQTRKTGRLHLIRGYAPLGSAGVRDGAVRDALYGKTAGFDALVDLVRAPCDRFAFHSGLDEHSAGEPISGSAEGILMELARQMDEQAR